MRKDFMQKQITTHMPRPNPILEQDHALLKHLPMVRFVARRIHGRLPKNIEIDDLLSAGMVGLVQAFAKFDPTKNVRFASFAQFRVRGAIMDSLRMLDWASRGLRRTGRQVQQAICTLTARLGRAPSEDQVAAELKLSLNDYQKLLGDLDGLEIGTLHRKREDGSGDEELIYVPGRPEDDPLFRCMRGEAEERLASAIQGLSETERLVTTLYYYEEMTIREIGLTLNLDQIKIRQIRTSAVLHLRAALTLPVPPSNNHRLLPMRKRRSKTLEIGVVSKLAA
ncbi:FliA/WhiG family RNA polymerase sigma factor [Acidicapsa acidisoli]|uniref:FliA/WhiG family RNA polymerase sigma factor n=1 Tax=Acidicapsa acidisoli TaxID=1615681 RepID=UPI0021DFA031|nr:FliA/WhiG family RNA polymerase sigma factor [Acidicapsa acidisoli]